MGIRSLYDLTVLRGPRSKDDQDDEAISLKDFFYFVTSCPSVLIYWHVMYIIAEVHGPTGFCRQLGYSQHISSSISLPIVGKFTLIDANVSCKKCMLRVTNFSLVIPSITWNVELALPMLGGGRVSGVIC